MFSLFRFDLYLLTLDLVLSLRLHLWLQLSVHLLSPYFVRSKYYVVGYRCTRDHSVFLVPRQAVVTHVTAADRKAIFSPQEVK